MCYRRMPDPHDPKVHAWASRGQPVIEHVSTVQPPDLAVRYQGCVFPALQRAVGYLEARNPPRIH